MIKVKSVFLIFEKVGLRIKLKKSYMLLKFYAKFN